MEIVIAGPGAGKTSNLSNDVMERLPKIEGSKRIFVITYTNNAVNVIRCKLNDHAEILTKKVTVSTIHSFLLSEVIFPYHHFLYGTKFYGATSIPLPSNPKDRNIFCKRLQEDNIIHNSDVFKVAKYILIGKSTDNKAQKRLRDKVLSLLCSYISDIFVDEAQDIDNYFSEVLRALEINGINISIIGDPNQNIKSLTGFSSLVNTFPPRYLHDNHRSPENHVMLLNNFVPEEQKQIFSSTQEGQLHYVRGETVESDVVINEGWDLVYIYEKSHEFLTRHSEDRLVHFYHSIVKIFSDLSIIEAEKHGFNILQLSIKNSNFAGENCIAYIRRINSAVPSSKDKKRIYDAFSEVRREEKSSLILVNSIDSIKGSEGERCLFILTSHVVGYLLNPKLDINKAKCKLFVALSRSTRNLTIYIHKSLSTVNNYNDLLRVLASYGFVDKTESYLITPY